MSPAEIQNRVVGIIGHKGTGKSTALIELLERRDRILLFDPKGEHEWLPNELSSPESLEEFLRWARKRDQWAAGYVPGEDLEAEAETICEAAYKRGDLALGIEEVSLFCSPNYLPSKVQKLVLTGRHREVDVFWSAQRFGECSRTLTSQTDEFIFFLQTEPRDLDSIAARTNRQIADQVAALGLHGRLRWDTVKRQLVADPRNTLPGPQQMAGRPLQTQ
jgi:hypothetical protein